MPLPLRGASGEWDIACSLPDASQNLQVLVVYLPKAQDLSRRGYWFELSQGAHLADLAFIASKPQLSVEHIALPV